jgi:hypothetical protein
MSTGGWIAIGLFVAVSAGAVFYLTLSRYQRISGHSFEIAILRTLAFVVILVGIGALSWWVGGAFLPTGRWRSAAIFLAFSILEATLGRGAMLLVTLVIERRFYL